MLKKRIAYRLFIGFTAALLLVNGYMFSACATELLKGGESKAAVRSVAFSGDGGSIVTAGGDVLEAQIFFWDTEGKLLNALRGHRGAVTAVAFSPDGKYLASAGEDALLKIYHTATRLTVAELIGHEGAVVAVVWSSSGKYVVSADESGQLIIWDSADFHMLKKIKIHKGRVSALAVQSKGEDLVTGGADGEIKVWQLPAGNLKQVVVSGNKPVTAIALSPDGQILTAVTGQLERWETTSWRKLSNLQIDTQVLSLAYQPDGRYMAVGHRNGKISIIDVHDGKTVKTFQAGNGAVLAVAYSMDGHLLLNGNADGNGYMWNIEGLP